MESFVVGLNHEMNKNNVDPNEDVFDSIWKEYKSVILQSLVTSFGLDFIVHDQYGGDVDTIYNVRRMKTDAEMRYKNIRNAADYANRGEYDSRVYHQDPRYIAINRNISEKKKKGILRDAYTGKRVARNANMDLDHVVSAKEIHDDPGRVLAGLNGQNLANCRENLKPTDRSINRSMQDKDIDSYLADQEAKKSDRCVRIAALRAKNSLTDKERKELEKLVKLEEIDPERMRTENRKSREAYEAKITRAYYTSEKFYKDTIIAATKRGAEMGVRQALGFVFVEIWMGAEAELKAIPTGSDLKDMLNAVAKGIKKGADRAKSKYKEIFSKFGEGFTAGSLASITTTICNIFLTTVDNLVRCIRQIYAAVIQAGKVLLFNPDNLMFGDRIKTATIILAMGASVVVGTAVGEIVGKTPAGAVPVIGLIVQTFTSTLVSGLLSCTLLVFLDRSKFMNLLIDKLNAIPSEVNNYKEVADALEHLAVKLADLDIAKFRADTKQYQKIAVKISRTEREGEVNALLRAAYETFQVKIPWEGDFDIFMGNRNNRLIFE